MKILITERQLKLIERVINNEVFCDKCNWNWSLDDGGNDPYICHKCGHDNTPDTNPTRYTYVTMEPFDSYGLNRFYFNNTIPVLDKTPIKGKIKIEGPYGDFVFNENDIRIDKIKNTINIDTSKFIEKYPSHEKINKASLIGITPQNIRKSLELAFPNNWIESTPKSEFSPGLRGIYTIGSKLNNNEDWSIMNYFDTKTEIHNLLYLKYKEDNVTKPIIDWLVDIFQNNKTFTKLLVDRQWNSIENGLKTERDSVYNFLNKNKGNNVTYYPYGSKMDRWDGVDVTIDDVNYQIKPLKKYKINENGEYDITTYGMKDYTKKRKVDKIAFSNKDTVIVFNNTDYVVKAKYNVIFKVNPNDINNPIIIT